MKNGITKPVWLTFEYSHYQLPTAFIRIARNKTQYLRTYVLVLPEFLLQHQYKHTICEA